MPLALTTRDIVLVLIIGLIIIVGLHYVWPFFMEEWINEWPDDGGERFGGYIGHVAVASIAIIYVVLVLSNVELGWMDTEPAVTAILATAAIIFGYPRLAPSPYLPAFELLPDKERTKERTTQRTTQLTVQTGQEAKAKLVVHNTSIASWGNFRISLESYEDDGITFAKNENSGRLSIMNDDTLIQMNSELLAPGEPAFLEFNVNADKEGEFRLRVRVTTGLRPGEKQDRRLSLIVEGVKRNSR